MYILVLGVIRLPENNFDDREQAPSVTVDCGDDRECRLLVARSRDGRLVLMIPSGERTDSLTVRVGEKAYYLGRGLPERIEEVAFDSLGLNEESTIPQIVHAVKKVAEIRLSFKSKAPSWPKAPTWRPRGW